MTIDREKLFAAVDRFKYPLLILVLGVVLMLIPTGHKDASSPPDAAEALAAVLSSVQGVGEARVLISENGVVIVCSGAESARTRLDIIRAVSSYTGFGSDKITILKARN